MKITRILCLILAVLMMTAAFVACDDTQNPNPDENNNNNNDTPTSISLELVEKGTPKYVIVRDYKASGTVLDSVATMVEAFKTYLNCDVEVKECYSDREVAEDVEQSKEILVGATNRQQSATVMDGLKSNDYAIDIVDEKVVIAGGSDAATAKAIANFLKSFVYEQGDKNEVRKNGKKFSLYAYKNLEDTDANNIYDVSEEEYRSTGIYSYDKAMMAGARLDSYVLVYPRDSVMSAEYRNFALAMQTYINKEVGFELMAKRDAVIVRADYKIVIGDTLFTDEGLVNALEDDEYYIALTATETTLEDGTVVEGATLTILFGSEAYDDAMNAYKKIMPPSSSPIDFNMAVGFVETNMKNPPAAQ